MSIKKYNDYHYERIDVNKLSPRFNEIISKFDSSKSVEEQSDLIREVDKVFSEYSSYPGVISVRRSRREFFCIACPPTFCFLSFYSISVYHKNG